MLGAFLERHTLYGLPWKRSRLVLRVDGAGVQEGRGGGGEGRGAESGGVDRRWF